MIKALGLISILLSTFYVSAQDSSTEFARHLYRKGYYSETLLELNRLSLTGKFRSYDSLQFYSGISLYQSGKTDSAIYLLSGLVSNSPFYDRGIQYSSLYLLEKNNVDSAYKILKEIPPHETSPQHVLQFQKDALELLLRKDTGFTTTDRELKQKLVGYKTTMLRFENRKPVIGGLLSAILPGLGKVYAGKPRQFLNTLIPIGIMGIQAWEGYRHNGFRSGRFWLFGSAFTVFYLGNIYGSAIAVRVAKHEQHEIAKEQIMVDLRVALRDLYGELWK